MSEVLDTPILLRLAEPRSERESVTRSCFTNQMFPQWNWIPLKRAGCCGSATATPNQDCNLRIPNSSRSRALLHCQSFGSRTSLVPHFINTTTFVASIFGSGETRRGSIPRSGAVTEEQRSQNRKATQPFGRRFFLAPDFVAHSLQTLKVCASLASRLGQKSLAANVVVFMKWGT